MKPKNVMILLRGIPGSGKTTLANKIRKKHLWTFICSADHYFERDGVYEFDAKKLPFAHKMCQESAAWYAEYLTMRDSLSSRGIVIIDNTNIRNEHCQVYKDIADKYGMRYVEITLNKIGAFEAYLRCRHNVPMNTILRMEEELAEQ